MQQILASEDNSPNINTLADGLIEKTSSMLDKIDSKTVHKDEEGERRKRSKTMSDVKPVENVSKNPQSFLEIRPVQKEVLPSHKLQGHAYE